MFNQSSPPFNIPGPPTQWPPQPYATSGWDKGGNLNQSLTALPQLNLQDQLNALLSVISRRQSQPRPESRVQRQPPPSVRQVQGSEGDRSSALANAKANDEMMKISEDQLSRNMRKIPIPMGPGGIYGTAYDWDTRSMTPGQQKMVSPERSGFQGEAASRSYAGPGGDYAGQGERQQSLQAPQDNDNSAAKQRYQWGNYQPTGPYSWEAGGGAMTPPAQTNADTQAALAQILGPLLGAAGGQLY